MSPASPDVTTAEALIGIDTLWGAVQEFAAALAVLDDEQWSHPSRCEGWSSRDVIVHLDSTNAFWAFSSSVETP